MNRGQLWVFSGLDGAGKSTQIELLMARLLRAGRRSQRVWVRGGYTPLFERLKALARRTRPGSLPPPGRSAQRDARLQSPLVRKTWLTIAMIDLLLYTAVYVRWCRWRGIDVLSDRWLDDTEIDFALHFPSETASAWLLWRLVKRAAPRPAAHLVFVVSVDEATRRSQAKAEPFPDPPETLRRRLAIYQAMAERSGISVIDGMTSRDALHARVVAECGLLA